MAKQDEKCRFNNLIHLVNEENLKGCFYSLKQNKASGIDGVTLEAYEANLTANLQHLVERMKRFSYYPQPVRRVYIPKAGGGERPLGIPAVEDKLVQLALSRILTAIYEVDFLDNSYGYRPGRSCHDALRDLNQSLMSQPIHYIIDADIKGFFDHVDHQWLIRCLEERIAERKFLRYIVRFLKAGVMEDGCLSATEEGTPQGGVISPILANIYLHYVLDLWIDKRVKRLSRGVVTMFRFADDFVICVQHQDEAERILAALSERLGAFGLQLSPTKTRLIEYGRSAAQNAARRGERPATFNFLGFTHYVDQTRQGRFKVGRTTDRRKMQVKLTAIDDWLKKVRNWLPIQVWWQTLRLKLQGHYRYYGVSGNYRAIQNYYHRVVGIAFKWLNRRSQKRSLNWRQFWSYLERHPLPKPKLYHNFYTPY
jgi:group II intron reverse transcriptase/maturase